MKKIIIAILVIIVIVTAVVLILQKFTNFKLLSYLKEAYRDFLNRGAKNYRPSGQESAVPKVKTYSAPSNLLNIFIRNSKFLPNTNAVVVGTEVSWINEDTVVHIVKGNDWDSGEIAAGQKFNKIFNQPGEYQYWCDSLAGAQGKIIVK